MITRCYLLQFNTRIFVIFVSASGVYPIKTNIYGVFGRFFPIVSPVFIQLRKTDHI